MPALLDLALALIVLAGALALAAAAIALLKEIAKDKNDKNPK